MKRRMTRKEGRKITESQASLALHWSDVGICQEFCRKLWQLEHRSKVRCENRSLETLRNGRVPSTREYSNEFPEHIDGPEAIKFGGSKVGKWMFTRKRDMPGKHE